MGHAGRTSGNLPHADSVLTGYLEEAMTIYKKRTNEQVRFLSDILIDKIYAPWYNFKDKYSGSPHTRLAACWQDIFLGLERRLL